MPNNATKRLAPLLLPLVAVLLGRLLISLGGWLGHHQAACPIHEHTGFFCAGCGGTRCGSALLTGDLLSAWNSNPLVVVGLLCIAAISLYLIVRVSLMNKPYPTIGKAQLRLVWMGLLAIVVFTVLRNTEAFAWMAP